MKMNTRLLRKIQKNILAEPLRLIMGQWVDAEDDVAPCNTAACIAGHALALDAMKKKNVDWQTAGKKTARRLEPLPNETISERAGKLLGLDREQAVRLFHTSQWPEKFQKQYDPHYSDYLRGVNLGDAVDAAGRRRQARIAVKRIEHFIKTNGEE